MNNPSTPGANKVEVRLQTKIILLTLGLLLSCAFLSSYFCLRRSRNTRDEIAYTQMKRVAALVATFHTVDETPDWNRTRRYVETIMGLHTGGPETDCLDLLFIRAFDKRGRLRVEVVNHALARSNNIVQTPVNGAPDNDIATAPYQTDVRPGELRRIRMPMRVNGIALGTIETGYFTRRLNRLEQVDLALSTAFVALLCLAGVGIAAAAAARVVRPIREIVDAMEGIARGDLDTRLGTRARDETRLLAEGFNNMAEQLKAARAEIDRKTLSLAESELRYRTLAEAAHDAIYILGPGGVLKYINPLAAAALGGAPDEFKGKTLGAFLPAEVAERYAVIESQLRDSRRPVHREHSLTRNGREIWLDTIFVPLRDESGALASVLGVSRNISERKLGEAERENLRRQLFQSQKMEALGTLAGGVAHDFNNMLSVLLGIADMALRKTTPDDPWRVRFEKIKKVAERARTLTTKLLTFARKDRVETESVQLTEIINDLVYLLKRSAPRNVEIATDLDYLMPNTLADPNQIHQALMNICINSIDAMPDGGTMKIATGEFTPDEHFIRANPGFKPLRYCWVSISDTGPGVSRDIAEKIFEPFFTTKEKGQGTGLGLSITMGIVKSHDGVILLESLPEGGATFRVFLPATDSPTSVRPGHEQTAQGAGEAILVIDDDIDFLEMASDILRDSGYDPVPVQGGRAALDLFSSRPDDFHLIILDMRMRELDGAAVFNEIRAIRPAARVVICSGSGPNAGVETLIAKGATAYIQKPFNISELQKTVRRALDG